MSRMRIIGFGSKKYFIPGATFLGTATATSRFTSIPNYEDCKVFQLGPDPRMWTFERPLPMIRLPCANQQFQLSEDTGESGGGINHNISAPGAAQNSTGVNLNQICVLGQEGNCVELSDKAMDSKEFCLISGNSHPELANMIASRLGVRLGNCDVHNKSNRETTVAIGESVRAKDVYIIQTGSTDVNNSIMEMLIMAYACKTSSARNIVGVIPYLPYSKQSKMRKRGCIVTKLLAKMLCKAGFTHIITMDLHAKEIQGFFDCPIDNLRASPFLLQYIQDCIPDYKNCVIVARNPGCAKKATSYAERLRVGIAVIHGEQKECESEEVDGRYSPPMIPRSRIMDVGVGVPAPPAKEKGPLTVVGDVGGRVAIMVEDNIDDATSFVAAAEVLKERGACKIYVLATHGVLSSDAPKVLESSAIDEIVVTNTVPHDLQKLQCHKIKTVDISLLLSEAIRRIHHKESMSYLFQNVTLED